MTTSIKRNTISASIFNHKQFAFYFLVMDDISGFYDMHMHFREPVFFMNSYLGGKQ